MALLLIHAVLKEGAEDFRPDISPIFRSRFTEAVGFGPFQFYGLDDLEKTTIKVTHPFCSDHPAQVALSPSAETGHRSDRTS